MGEMMVKGFGIILNKVFLGIIIISVILEGCAYSTKDTTQDKSKDLKQLWEFAESPNGKCRLDSIITHEDGVELYLDGKRITHDNMDIEYCPTVNNRGDFAYARFVFDKKYSASQIMLNGKKIFDDGTLCDRLKLTEEFLLFSSSSFPKKSSHLYKYSLKTKQRKELKSFTDAYVDDIRVLDDNHVAIIVREMSRGRKYALYNVNLLDDSVSLVMEGKEKLLFSGDEKEGTAVDQILSGNGKNNLIFLNAWYWFYHYQYGEPFANGNDFCGRISWNQSYRLQGILELYRKTGDAELKETLRTAVQNTLMARNEKIGLSEDSFNPAFLWSSRRYSIDGYPIALMVNNGMILDALLSVANEGILDRDTENEIYDVARKAFTYYETYYDGNGHYIFQPGSSFYLDGVVLPWNQQNAMVSAFLELWQATGEAKYLERCEEMIETFRVEWEEKEGKIRWYYWPKSFYDGWDEKSGISKNTKSRKAVELETVSFEDISHAGVNAATIAKYYHICPDGIISSEEVLKIQANMEDWCFENGFAGNIGGGTDISFAFGPSSGWGNYYNRNLEQYIYLGASHNAAVFDLQSFLFLAAQYYHPQSDTGNEPLKVDRYTYGMNGHWDKTKSFLLNEDEIKNYVKENYKAGSL